MVQDDFKFTAIAVFYLMAFIFLVSSAYGVSSVLMVGNWWPMLLTMSHIVCVAAGMFVVNCLDEGGVLQEIKGGRYIESDKYRKELEEEEEKKKKEE
jgi:hypothetical protein